MTRLAKSVREVPALIRDAGRLRPIMIGLASCGIYLRQKRTRRAFLLPYEAAYSTAVRLKVEAERREKKATRRRP